MKFFVFFFASLISSEAANYTDKNAKLIESDFQCFQQSGQNNTILADLGFTSCPSGKCIVFYDFCSNAWSSGCYDMKYSMKLSKRHKQIHRQKIGYFKYWFCETSRCNSNPCQALQNETFMNSSDVTFVNQEPNSLDSKLWPKLVKNKKRSSKLKNGIIIYPENDNSKFDTINFNGNLSSNATKIWVDLQFLNSSGSIQTAKLSLNFDALTMTVKIKNFGKPFIWRKSIMKKPYRKTLDLDIYFSRGNFNAFSFYINNVDNYFAIPKKLNFGKLVTVYFGGDFESLTSNDGKEEIGFERIFSSNITCPADPYSFKSGMGVTGTEDTFTRGDAKIIFGDVLENFISKSYEFRKSLCPGSDLIRLDIKAIPHLNGTVAYHSNLWKRMDFQWSHEVMFIEVIQNCTRMSMIISENIVTFLCNEHVLCATKLSNFPTPTNYIIDEEGKKFICEKQ